MHSQISSTLSSASREDITLKLETFVRKIASVERQQNFLEGLMYESMKRRHDMIKEAHKKTINWIFERAETGFKKWLEADDSIYWVQGKVSE